MTGETREGGGSGGSGGSARPVAIVTGASRGLGFLLARELGRRGHDLVVCARSADGLAAAAADLSGTGADVLTVPCDVAVRAEVERLAAAAVERFGRIDVLVTNAGHIKVGPLDSMRVEDVEQALGVMFWGVVHPVLAVLPLMRRRGAGRIVTITSIGGQVPAPHLAPYVAAKFAAVGFSDTLAAELAGERISVTTVVPGLMRTGSPVNASFTGDAVAEYRWFTAADSVPLLSMDAERAARRIVSGALRGRRRITLTPLARVTSRLYGLAPATTTRLAGVAERLLPAGNASGTRLGRQAEPAQRPAWFRLLTRGTHRPAARHHQHQDVPPPAGG